MLCIPEKTETFLRIELQGVLGFQETKSPKDQERHFFTNVVYALLLLFLEDDDDVFIISV